MITFESATNSELWAVVYRPFINQKIKEGAREELRAREAYGEPIVAIEAVEKRG